MTGKVAILADIHGNAPALQAVIADIQNQGYRRAFVLGDIINGIDPAGCVELLWDWRETLDGNLACIKGNAESYLMTPDPEAIPGHHQHAWHEDLLQLFGWFRSQLSVEQLAWIQTFPTYIRWNDAILVHDHPNDRLYPETWHKPNIDPKYQEWFYHAPGIQPDMAEDEWQRLLLHMEEEQFRQVFCGHTHMPFLREQDGKVVCNVGSVGVPLDGDLRRGWVSVEDFPDGRLEIAIPRVAYDIGLIHQLIDDTPGYPRPHDPSFKNAYKKWFSTGIYWKAHLY